MYSRALRRAVNLLSVHFTRIFISEKIETDGSVEFKSSLNDIFFLIIGSQNLRMFLLRVKEVKNKLLEICIILLPIDCSTCVFSASININRFMIGVLEYLFKPYLIECMILNENPGNCEQTIPIILYRLFKSKLTDMGSLKLKKREERKEEKLAIMPTDIRQT
ncbi:hypothetical protein BpHYR1_042279 [Brachionus plicatilis]|uniref:Uncharacterized protein n=1 Tax=Brachionus plicatilis TaxID=10195 RepID=A0A3M7R609_BRAPC|nr:hypothetical protein BpHYR1_042279 [Brachionus plicatilis]